MTSGTLVIWSLSRLDNGTRRPCPDGFDWSAGSSMTASGMGHWKRLIIIPGGTDCYYCINNITCLIHVFYCLVVHVPVSDHFAVIMLPVYVVTLPVHAMHSVVASYSCTCIICIAYILSPVFRANIITVYAQHSIIVMLHMHTACSFLSHHHYTTLFMI